MAAKQPKPEVVEEPAVPEQVVPEPVVPTEAEVQEEQVVPETPVEGAESTTEETQPEVEEDTEEAVPQEEVTSNGAGDGREPQIAKEPETSFDERTGSGTPPWQRPDGSQNNGSEE